MITAVLISQIISNVPAALLLSGFTEQWDLLLVGVNVGGLGTLIASMASLISYKYVSQNSPAFKKTYFRLFTGMNLIFLMLLLLLYALLAVKKSRPWAALFTEFPRPCSPDPPQPW